MRDAPLPHADVEKGPFCIFSTRPHEIDGLGHIANRVNMETWNVVATILTCFERCAPGLSGSQTLGLTCVMALQASSTQCDCNLAWICMTAHILLS